jgi:hypothetical protein
MVIALGSCMKLALRNNWLKLRLEENFPSFEMKNLWSLSQIPKGELKDYNMETVGLGDTIILTIYAQNLRRH